MTTSQNGQVRHINLDDLSGNPEFLVEMGDIAVVSEKQ